MLPVASQLASQSNILVAASVAPSSIAQNEIVGAIFSGHEFSSTVPEDGYLALADDPSRGFSPFRTDSGTQVLFVPNPSQLGIPFGAEISPHWRNSLGLVLMRNPAVDMVGAIALHGLMRNPWSEIAAQNGRDNAWQALGGCMAFTDRDFSPFRAANDSSVSYALRTVLDKGMAMTPKWRHIDGALQNAGHHMTTDLGGAKSVFLHQPGREAKVASIGVLAEVAVIIGAYIAGSDQNMGPEWSDIFGRQAPINFMGAQTTHPLYQGLTPSPMTAEGVYAALATARDELRAGDREPIFFMGYGGVGKPIVDFAVADGHQIAGIIERDIEKLASARKQYGSDVPLFYDITGLEAEQVDALQEEASRHKIQLVKGTREALSRIPDDRQPTILSPNAGAHPIDSALARYIVEDTSIKIVVGAANNMFGLVGGSEELLAWYLQKNGVYVANDSASNRMGALAVTVKKLQLDQAGIAAQIERIRIGRRQEIDQGFRNGIPPQIYTNMQAHRSWNELLQEGLAVGGYFYIYPPSPPSDEDIKRLMRIS